MTRTDPAIVEQLRVDARARIANSHGPDTTPAVARPPVARCRSCSAPIWWRLNPNGTAQPMNYDLVTATALRDSHFVTCPQRDQWRKRDQRSAEATGQPGLFAP